MADRERVVLVGDGWAALGAAGFLAQAGVRTVWLPASGARMLAPMPQMEAGPGVGVWRELARRWDIETGEALTGTYLREFRNKAFRPPAWFKAPTPEARSEVRDEMLSWPPEARFAPAFEARFSAIGLPELEEALRARVLEAFAGSAELERRDGVPIRGFAVENGSVRGVILGSGEEIACDRVIYADRWRGVAELEGLPKGMSLNRRRDPVGVLQALFTHEAPIPQAATGAMAQGFFGALHKESGEEIERHVWGCFSADGTRSSWTVLLAPEESEDNHQIAKKLRRMKQTLDRMFAGSEWLAGGRAELTATVASEQVRFEEAIVFGGGEPPRAPVRVPEVRSLAFLTDGYGPASALHQVHLLLGADLGIELNGPSEAPDDQEPAPSPGSPA